MRTEPQPVQTQVTLPMSDLPAMNQVTSASTTPFPLRAMQ